MQQFQLDLNLRVLVSPQYSDLIWSDGSGPLNPKEYDDETIMILLQKGDLVFSNPAQVIGRSLVVEAAVMGARSVFE